MNYDPNYPPPPNPYGAPPPHGGYGGPYAPPPRKGRGGLIALIVLLVLAGAGAGAYFTGALDPLLKKIGIQLPITDEDGNYTSRGLSQAKAVIGGKRWADPGQCATHWTDFGSDGAARSYDGSSGTWDLTRDQKLTLTDATTGRATTIDAGADYVLDETIGTFRLQRAGQRSIAMEYCGPAQ